MNQLVSVIIPVYNVRHYLREAIESVLHQTYKNLQILIIDDGSTDGSEKICDEYGVDSRATVIHQKNRGLSVARNAGLDLATEDYIAFLDPDDVYDHDFIRRMIYEMQLTSSNVVVCRFTDGKRIFPSIEAGSYDRVCALRALAENKIYNSVWNKLYKRELFETIRFPDGHVYEDVEVMFRILDHCNKVAVLDVPLYHHRNRTGSITNTITEKNIRDWCLAEAHYIAFIKEHIPEIFTKEHIKTVNESKLKILISLYSRYPRSESQSFKRALRRRIIKAGKSIEKDGIRIRIAYTMILYCPGVLRIIYPVYHPIRLLVYRVVGR